MRTPRMYLAGVLLAMAIGSACGGDGGPVIGQRAPAVPVPPASGAAGGDVYVFGKAQVAIMDVPSGAVLKTITSGLEGITTWDDAVRSPDGRRLFISAHAKNEVLVFDTVQRTLVTTIHVGVNPVHLNVVNNGKEVWSHSDAEGTFYVVDTATLQVIDKVDASTTHSGHGALLAMPGDTKYYATNVNTPAVFVIDGRTRKVTGTIPLCGGADGTGGAHGIGFTAVNRYVYVQCSGSPGRVAVVASDSDTLAPYLDSSGDIYMSPDGADAAIANSRANTLDIIDAAPGAARVSQVPIPNRAASAYFSRVDGKLLAFVADLKSPDVEVVDVAAKKVIKTIAGAALASQGPDSIVPRSSDLGGEFFYTVVRPAGVINVVDVHTWTLAASVAVDGAFTVVYVGHPGAAP